ncbi:MAG: NADH-quinone oxidoreductase subunit C/D [Candidatus Omnitrophota bacterium]
MNTQDHVQSHASQLVQDLRQVFGKDILTIQDTQDQIPTLWVSENRLIDMLNYLKGQIDQPFSTLYDLTAIDERKRKDREGQPASDFTGVYHLLSYERNQDIRLKVPLQGEAPQLPTITGIYPSANWYEREIWDMFGIHISNHPDLRRILLPSSWKGHPLRKEHPCRATEMGPFLLPDEREEAEQDRLKVNPEAFGMKESDDDTDYLFLNFGPQHPGTHGPMRIILQLSGEKIRDAVMDIGYHHRAAEKMGERQTWHSYIPYTDRIDYLGGVMNNFPYVLAVEQLAGIEVPDRVKTIRIMMAELFRLSSHLVWYGTFLQDMGALSPVFYMFSDRERILKIVEAVTGARLHPGWFRIGGVTNDLPHGWDKLVKEFIDYFPGRLKEYDGMMMENRIVKARTVGIGAYSVKEAIEWGVTGPNLRACGFNWDWRKKRPYSGYEHFEFEIPIGKNGDCYDRGRVRVEEMRQSLRIITQCLENMPPGKHKSDHPLTTPPLKERTMHDIETLITHFLGVSWGPVLPAGESFVAIEATKGSNGYYLISDHNVSAYRLRVRTPSFAHLQTVPLISRGLMVADLIAILGSIDFVLGDVDR